MAASDVLRSPSSAFGEPAPPGPRLVGPWPGGAFFGKCRYIFNDEIRRGEPIHWCGRSTWRGSYCEEHWRLCHRPSTKADGRGIAATAEAA
jgi:hypothetical protein